MMIGHELLLEQQELAELSRPTASLSNAPVVCLAFCPQVCTLADTASSQGPRAWNFAFDSLPQQRVTVEEQKFASSGQTQLIKIRKRCFFFRPRCIYTLHGVAILGWRRS